MNVRLWLVFPLILVGAVAMLFVGTLRDLLRDMDRALMAYLDWLIKWACPAQAIEAQRAATTKIGAVADESAVGEADAPKGA
jgi:hypothetical protein